MQTKEQRVQTAFILSIIGYSVADLFFLALVFYYRVASYITSNTFALFFVLPSLVAPLVLGSIALSMIRDARGVKGKYRVFYVIARILSIVSIVVGAIMATVAIIYLGVLAIFFIPYMIVI